MLVNGPRPAHFRRITRTSALRRAVACALVATTAIGPAASSGSAAPQQAPAPCPNPMPPPPVDTSEVPKPGALSPAPLPMPTPAVGGDKLGGCDVIVPVGAAAPPADVNAETWVLADLTTGDVLAAKNPHGRQRPASTLKVLTALLALRELKLTDTLVATQADADQEGSKVGLGPGVTYTIQQVISGLIMRSGNDAAHALAMKMGGMEATVAKMNALAAQLGARDTRAASPSGLDGPGMSTSAYDLALIYRAAMQRPDFTAISAIRETTLPATDGQPMGVASDNRILQTYPGAIGGKTGFTDDAQHTLITAAERNGRRLVAVLMRSDRQLNEQGVRLLDYGFGFWRFQPIGRLVPEVTEKPNPTPAPHAPIAADARQESSMFGTVGTPLTVLGVAGVALITSLLIRRRRAKIAATRGDSGSDRS